MALVTVPVGQAGDGQLVISLTYDDVTLVVSTMTYTMLSGAGAVVFDGVQTMPLTIGAGRSLIVPGSRALQNGRGIGFRWSPA